MKQTILMIEDNPHILRLNRSVLSAQGYRILEADTIAKGRAVLEQEKPELIILDILLPDGNGLDFCEELRQKSDIPVLLLTALKEDEEIVAGFKRGGDEYISKPYNTEVFIARVAALLRRAEQTVCTVVTRGMLSLDTGSQTLKIGEKDTALSYREFNILLYLVRNEGRVIRAEELYKAAWGRLMANDANAVRAAVSRLRKKIESFGYVISDGRSDSGYCFTRRR